MYDVNDLCEVEVFVRFRVGTKPATEISNGTRKSDKVPESVRKPKLCVVHIPSVLRGGPNNEVPVTHSFTLDASSSPFFEGLSARADRSGIRAMKCISTCMGKVLSCVVSCVITMAQVAQIDMRPFWASTPLIGWTPQVFESQTRVLPTWL